MSSPRVALGFLHRCRLAVLVLVGPMAHGTPAEIATAQVAEKQGASRWAAAPRLGRLCATALPAIRPARLGVRGPTAGAKLLTIIISIVRSYWCTLWLALAWAVLRMRGRRRSAGLLWLAMEVFFTMLGILMSVVLGLVLVHATASSTSSLASSTVSHPCGQVALPSAVPPRARAVARPAAPWGPVAAKAGALRAVK